MDSNKARNPVVATDRPGQGSTFFLGVCVQYSWLNTSIQPLPEFSNRSSWHTPCMDSKDHSQFIQERLRDHIGPDLRWYTWIDQKRIKEGSSTSLGIWNHTGHRAWG